MIVLLKIRMKIVDLPKCLPHKFGGKRQFRYLYNAEEDVFHTIMCAKDNMEKIITVADIAQLSPRTNQAKPRPV